MGGLIALQLAAAHPARVDGAVVIGAATPFLSPPPPDRLSYSFTDELDTDEGWATFNQHAWRRDHRGFLEFFFAQVFPEPHSTKQIDDMVAFGLDTTPETLIRTQFASWGVADLGEMEAICRRVRCPVLVLHGTDDRIVPYARGSASRS